IARHVHLSNNLAKRAVGCIDGAFPAVLLLRSARELLPVKREAFVSECRGEDPSVAIELVELQIITPDVERHGLHERRDPSEGDRMPNDDRGGAVETRARQKSVPLDPGGTPAE